MMEVHDQENKVLSESLKFLDLSTADHESQNTLSNIYENLYISSDWNDAFEIEILKNFILRGRVVLENIDENDMLNKSIGINDKAYQSTGNLKTDFQNLQGVLIFSSIFSSLPFLMREYDKIYLISSQKCKTLLSSYDKYNLDLYSKEKIYQFFNQFNFKGVHLKFEDIPVFNDSFCSKTADKYTIFSSYFTNKRNFLDNEMCLESFEDILLFSKAANCFEKKQNPHILCLKSQSVKTDHTIELNETYKQMFFPSKKGKNQPETGKENSHNRTCYSVLTKNRQLHGRFHYSKRNYIKNGTNYIEDDSHTSNCNIEDEIGISNLQEGSIDSELPRKKLSSRIAEIRQRVENLSCHLNYESNRKEQHHFRFIEHCNEISNSIISFNDYDEIYNTEMLNECVSNYDACEDSSSEYETIRFYQVPNQISDTINFSNPVQKQTETFLCEALNQFKTLNSENQVLKQSDGSYFGTSILKFNEIPVSLCKSLNQFNAQFSQRQVLKESEATLNQKYLSYLRQKLSGLQHQIADVLSTISMPFIASYFVKK